MGIFQKMNEEVNFFKPIHENVFEHMWPDMTGIGARLERYHRDPHLPFITSVTSLKINLMMREIFIETLN